MITYGVSTCNQLVEAMDFCNTSSADDTILIKGVITRTGPLRVIGKRASSGGAAADSGTVTIAKLAPTHEDSKGGAGGNGRCSGGGAAALPINSGTKVTLDTVAFSNNGGDGGDGGDGGAHQGRQGDATSAGLGGASAARARPST